MNYIRTLLLVSCWSLSVSAADGSWTDRWNLKGDFRFRNEQIKDGANTAGTVTTETEENRHRIRARLSLIGKVNDSVETTIRLATGSTAVKDSTTTNQTLTDYNAKKTIDLDMAYANWHARENGQVWIGKSPIPYFQPGTSDLLIDTDITPEGIAYKDQCKCDNFGTFWNFGYSMLNARHDSVTPVNQTDVMMIGAEVGVNLNLGDAKVVLGAGSLNFPNIKDTSAVNGTSFAKGNSTTAGNFTYEYRLTRGFLEAGLPLFGTPFSIFLDYAKNGDPSDDNIAQLYGIKIGQLKDKGDLTFSIDFRDLKKDSIVGILAESDGAGGGTDVKSTRYQLQYQLDKGINVAASYYDGKRNVSTLDIPYKRAMLDFGFAF